jgi:hypothetical protein
LGKPATWSIIMATPKKPKTVDPARTMLTMIRRTAMRLQGQPGVEGVLVRNGTVELYLEGDKKLTVTIAAV